MRLKKILIGTRGSKLALIQANLIKKMLEDLKLVVELKIIKTTGDIKSDTPLSQIGGKGLFIKEIEQALIEKTIDIAVHSMKDMPAELPEGLEIAAMLKREDVRDALISKDNIVFKKIKSGSIIGTSSLRRECQLKNNRPDLIFKPIRGNVDTRIKKVKNLEVDGVILASAGLNRMNLADNITEKISLKMCLPAVGQGAIGVELRSNDEHIKEIVLKLNHKNTFIAVSGERAFLKCLGGSCRLPIACLGQIDNGEITLKGLVGKADGKKVISDVVSGSIDKAVELGTQLGNNILKKGGHDFVKEALTL